MSDALLKEVAETAAKTPSGLDTHPMDGFDHDGVKKAFDIPDNYWVLLLSFLREAKGNRE